MSTPSWSAITRASGSGRTLKPMITAPDAAASITSDLEMPPTPVCRTRRCTSACESLAIWSWIASSEPLTSAFSTRLRSTAWPCCTRSKTSSRLITAPRRRASASVLRRFARSPAKRRASRSLSTTRTVSPASGTLSNPRISTGSPGSACFMRWPMKSCIARTRPQCAPATSASPESQRAALHQHRDDRPATRVEPRLDDGAAGRGVRVGPQLLDLGDAAGSCRAGCRGPRGPSPTRRRRSCRRPSPRASGPAPASSPRTRFGSASGLSILLTAITIGTLGRLGVVDRLRGLRHHAVVCRDHDHRDVGHLRAAGAHRGERLVARRVEEGHHLAAVVHLVGADVLRDAAGLARPRPRSRGSRPAARSSRGRRGP